MFSYFSAVFKIYTLIMKRNLIKISVLSLLTTLSFLPSVHSQNLEIVNLLSAGKDAGTIGGAYLTPVFRGFGAALNNGWYNTAHVHKTGRFDISFNAIIVSIPTEDQSFDVGKLNLVETHLHKGTDPISPTFTGKATPGSELYVLNSSNTDTIKFKSPSGAIPLSFLFAPTLNVGVGIIKGTELDLRYIPTINVSGISMGLYGFGIKHDIKQWIPGIAELPFDWSFQAAYTRFNFSYDIDQKSDGAKYHDQELSMKTNAYTFNTLISKKLAILTVYAGFGYQGSSSTIAEKGTYNIPAFNSSGAKSNIDVTDPVTMSVVGTRTPTVSAGLRLKLAVLTFSGGLTYSKYSSYLGGLGIAIDIL